MINTDKDALMCDLAEVYHIHDMKSLQAETAAAFACGLREDSRIKQKLSGRVYPSNKELLMLIYDLVHWLQWAKTENGAKNRDHPESLYSSYFERKQEQKTVGFSSPDDFDKARNRILKEGKANAG